MLGKHFGDGGGQSGLAVIDVADGADVDVWLASIKLFLAQILFPSLLN
jgi:hypothetical protein